VPEVLARARSRAAAGTCCGERGQSTLLGAGVLGVCVLVASLVAVAGTVAAERASARTAADAAALAAAVGETGEQVGLARDAAGRNGAEVEAVDAGPGWAEVTVRVGRATATARAEVRPP